MLPLHIVWNRARGGAYTSIALAGAGIFGVFLFLTYFLQQNLGFSPLTTGVAFLPLTGVLVVTSTTVQTRVLQRTGVKPLVVAGMILGIVGMFLFARLTPSSGYATGVLPGLLIIGLGMGCVFAPAFSTATLGVADHEAGIASAMVNTSQQVGGSVGTALLSTLFASAVTNYSESHAHLSGVAGAALVHGYTVAFWWAAGFFAVGLLLAAVILPARIRLTPRGSQRSSPATQSAIVITSILLVSEPAPGECAPRGLAVWLDLGHRDRHISVEGVDHAQLQLVP